MSLLGLDIGTSGCKAAVFSESGALLALARAEYPLYTSSGGYIELDSEAVWLKAADCIRSVNAQTLDNPVHALATSVLGEAIIPVGSDGQALAFSPVSFDLRARKQSEFFRRTFGDDRAYALTGHAIHPMHSIHKISWWREEQPELFARTWKFLCYGDYLLSKLGLEPVIDYTMAARTQAFDISALRWSDEILAWAGIDAEKLAMPLPSGAVVGTLPDSVAHELGFSRSVTVIAGGHDQPCAALGSGALQHGEAMYSFGTTAVLAPSLHNYQPALAVEGFPCYPHVIPNRWVTLAGTPSGGSILRWFRDEFGDRELRKSLETGRDVYEVLIEQAVSTPGPLLLLPHFAGTEAPYHDSDAHGVLFGLSLSTRRADVVQALLEGIAFELNLYSEHLRAAGVEVSLLRAVGGGARSERWMQMNADILNIPVAIPKVVQATSFGAALLAGWGAGCYDSLESAVGLIHVERTLTPRAHMVEQYAPRMVAYKHLYPAVRALNPLF